MSTTSKNSLGIVSLILLLNHISAFHGYYVEISNDGPAVIGANITFTAKLFDEDGKRPDDIYKYRWRDNLYPQHEAEFIAKAESTWNVGYPTDQYKPGRHSVRVEVYVKEVIIDWWLCTGTDSFEITDLLNGNLTLLQNNVTMNTEYISNSVEVFHEIKLNFPDETFLKHNASSIKMWWFVDCVYVGSSSNLTFRHTYAKADVFHHIDALLFASNSPATSHSPLSVTPSLPTNSTHEDVMSSTPSDVLLNTITDSTSNTKFSYLTVSNATKSSGAHSDIPFDCPAKQIVNRKPDATYGLFSRKIEVKAPVSNVTTKGDTWLTHGAMLNITVSCQGSGPFKVCHRYQRGYHNKTGNETCDYEMVLETCDFPCFYYLQDPIHYSLILIISNDINKIVRTIGIDVYEAVKQPQLSVIVVPVSAGIVAVVLIIFGIAYYIQSRNRFIVEVADFDFSTNANDMEYKTFRERLVEAVHNAFDKTEDFYEQDSTNGVPTNGKKYGSMQ